MSKSTRLIPQTTTATNDAEILDAVEKTFAKATGSTSSTWKIGIRNDSGIPYREVLLDGFDQLPSLSNRLQKLGFTEEMDDEGGMIDGYDATFRKGK